MRQLVASQPAAAMAMMRAMSAELGNMTRQVVDLKVRIAAQRLGTYPAEPGEGADRDTGAVRLPVPKGLLAAWLGCRAENLSRAFMSLRAYGVETHGSRVVLHDISRLQAYAGVIEHADAAQRPACRWKRCSVTRSGCVPSGPAASLSRRNAPMTIASDASYLEVIIYLLCVATSLLCAYLLARA